MTRNKSSAVMSDAINAIRQERSRQIACEGYSPAQDQQYINGELAQAAAALALGSSQGHPFGEALWPKNWSKFKGHTPPQSLNPIWCANRGRD